MQKKLRPNRPVRPKLLCLKGLPRLGNRDPRSVGTHCYGVKSSKGGVCVVLLLGPERRGRCESELGPALPLEYSARCSDPTGAHVPQTALQPFSRGEVPGSGRPPCGGGTIVDETGHQLCESGPQWRGEEEEGGEAAMAGDRRRPLGQISTGPDSGFPVSMAPRLAYLRRQGSWRGS